VEAYLDHAATTPLRQAARQAMSPWLGELFGNPSGSHPVAARARAALDDARDVLAQALGTVQGDLVLTSGGTEAANLAVVGRVSHTPGAVVVSAVEHHAVLEAARLAQRHHGCEVRVVGVNGQGQVDLDQLGAALDRAVSIVSVQLVNNEVGTVQPLDRISRLVRRRAPQAVLHTDAVQAVPWFDVAAMAEGADMISVSAHKFGGPQGIGALAFRRPVALGSTVVGGPQERGRRAGTQNVAGALGMAAAIEATAAERSREAKRVRELRDGLVTEIRGRLSGVRETAAGAERAPGHCHLLVEGVESEALLVLLGNMGVSASAGSACASGAMEPSHVLTAMAYSEREALGALRLTLGHTTMAAEVEYTAEAVVCAVDKLRRGARVPVAASPNP
jgi:cysteine desulfurase